MTAFADLILSVKTCSCRAYPAVHRADLHDPHGQITDIQMVPDPNWDALQHATCLRCGWRSVQSWFAEDFRRSPAQTASRAACRRSSPRRPAPPWLLGR